MTRSADRAGALRAVGAEAVVADALNRAAFVSAVAGAKPDVVVHQLTALSSFTSLRRFEKEFDATNRLRTEGTAKHELGWRPRYPSWRTGFPKGLAD